MYFVLTDFQLFLNITVDHNGHEDWYYVFTVSGISVCDDVDVEVTGISDGNERVEFDGSLEIPGKFPCTVH